MEQPYTANTLIIKSVGMLPGASAEYTSLSINVQHPKNTGCSMEQPYMANILTIKSVGMLPGASAE